MLRRLLSLPLVLLASLGLVPRHAEAQAEGVVWRPELIRVSVSPNDFPGTNRPFVQLDQDLPAGVHGWLMARFPLPAEWAAATARVEGGRVLVTVPGGERFAIHAGNLGFDSAVPPEATDDDLRRVWRERAAAGPASGPPAFPPLGAEVLGDPEALVKGFIADYRAWNDWANAETEDDVSRPAMERAEAVYRALLDRYCRPGFEGKLIAFGSRSAHDPVRERIVSVATRGNASVVKTTYTGAYETTTDWEYHLAFQGGRWYLEEVYYVDGDERHETL